MKRYNAFYRLFRTKLTLSSVLEMQYILYYFYIGFTSIFIFLFHLFLRFFFIHSNSFLFLHFYIFALVYHIIAIKLTITKSLYFSIMQNLIKFVNVLTHYFYLDSHYLFGKFITSFFPNGFSSYDIEEFYNHVPPAYPDLTQKILNYIAPANDYTNNILKSNIFSRSLI